MISIRTAEWPQDIGVLSALDTEFETGIVYQPVRDELSFRLEPQTVIPSLRKRYAFAPEDPNERQNWEYAAIAELDGELAGFAAAQLERWNRRVVLHHLYVMPNLWGQGVGTALLNNVGTFGRAVNARNLWLETQNVNYPAIQFYRRSGFSFCGFDESLYDPASLATEEIALFFSRAIAQGV